MWGEATGNDDLSRLGRLQLGVLARSLSEYFLMMDDNEVHPPAFVRNKVGFIDTRKKKEKRCVRERQKTGEETYVSCWYMRRLTNCSECDAMGGKNSC